MKELCEGETKDWKKKKKLRTKNVYMRSKTEQEVKRNSKFAMQVKRSGGRMSRENTDDINKTGERSSCGQHMMKLAFVLSSS